MAGVAGLILVHPSFLWHFGAWDQGRFGLSFQLPISIGAQGRFSRHRPRFPAVPLPVDLSALLSSSLVESERIELKEGWNPESVLHTLCAFASDFHNLGGGYVIIGASEEDGHARLPPTGSIPGGRASPSRWPNL